MRRILFLAVFGMLVVQLGAAHPSAVAPPLNYFKNYFLTGDYVVGGTSLWRRGVNGRASETISVAGVPAGVDVVSAFLYVQTAEIVQWSGIDHARFNGIDLGPGSASVAKALNWGLATTPCWSVNWGGGRRLVTYRADVLRFLPLGTDGKTQANGAFSIEVPDFGINFPDTDEGGSESGGTGPRAVGASLVVVYRDPTKPFRGIVIYDGGFTKTAFATMDLPLGGFYQAATDPAARMSLIVGDGRPYLSERVRLNGALIATNPFASTRGAKWDNPTFSPLPVAPGAPGAALQVTPDGLFSDCLSFSAVVFSTIVQDTDGDGLLDIWESSDAPLLDPNGQPLPLLKAMGADPYVQDIFVEVGYMYTEDDPSPDIGPPTYGGVAKPAHTHQPPHETVKLLGDTFANAPTGPIRLHVDLGDSYPHGEADEYIIRGPGLARGGEAINELATVCTRGPTDPPDVCQFSEYPGTVGWKTGFQFLRDEVLSGPAPLPGGEDPCDAPGNTCERRFDRNRKDMFRYGLFAHAVGLPKSESPFDPDFNVPRTNTGVGDFTGGDFMMTLGGFDDDSGLPVGTPFMQASTWLHEKAHGFERRHGGEAFQPNCKPLFFSALNYLYQLRGLLDNDGRKHLDLSRYDYTAETINEQSLFDGSVSSLPYRIGWYAPLATSYLASHGTPVSKHCDGSPLLPTDVPMVRIDARTSADAIDWKADAVDEITPFAQDINFNGRTTRPDSTPELLAGSDDWSRISLRQMASRRSGGGLFRNELDQYAMGPLSLDAGRGDLGRGDLGRGDLGRGDLGRGDLGRGDLGRGDLGRGDLGTIFGRGDLGRGDLGGGDLFVGDPSEPFGELDADTAADLAKTPPGEFRACVLGESCAGGDTPLHRVRLDWIPPTVGAVNVYEVLRALGPDLTPEAIDGAVSVGQEDATLGQEAYSLVDQTPLLNGQSYTYFARAVYTDGTLSDPSNVVTVFAVNDPPAAAGDDYATDEDTPFAQAAPGVLFNDTDADGGGTPTAALVSGPSHGTLALNSDGSFLYTPAANYHGPDAFTYRADDGPAQGSSATVNITVNPVNDVPMATGEAYATAEDVPLVVAAPGVLANDSDLEGPTLTAVLASGPSHGMLALAPDGSFTYTPAANYNGPDQFTYSANDGAASSAAAVVSLTITPVNDAPSFTIDIADRAINANGTTGPIPFTIADDDLAGVSVSGSSSNTTLVPNANIVFGGSGANRTVTVTPAPNKTGSSTITVKVTDGSGLMATDTFALTVNANYTFCGIQNVPPPYGSKFKTGSTIPMKWGFKHGSYFVDSGSVGHMVTVTGPMPGGPIRTYTNTDPGSSSFRYSDSSKTWTFNLQTKDNYGNPFPTGTYDVKITPLTPGYAPSETFQIKLVK
jgi:VCBS repeat-containing protein